MDKPTEFEINTVLDACSDAMENGTAYPGMSYEDGLREGIEWMQEGGDLPLGD